MEIKRQSPKDRPLRSIRDFFSKRPAMPAEIKIDDVEGVLITTDGETPMGSPIGLSIHGEIIVFQFRVPGDALVGELRHGAVHRLRMGKSTWVTNIDLETDVHADEIVTVVQAVTVAAGGNTGTPMPEGLDE